jgi:ubiquinone/menaquinone biosynthesis C-methylase UbiE
MLERAKKNAPGISFIHMNATEIPYVEEFDAVFSNAVFHWIDDQDKLLTNIARALKMKGQLVCEFGGVGCAKLVHETLEEVFSKYGLQYINYFYFPSIGEYAPRLEKAGLKVEYAYLFERPTFLKKGETVIDWINMFVTQAFEGIEASLKQQILEETKEKLKPYLMKEEGWWIDYVRIRIKAIKTKP